MSGLTLLWVSYGCAYHWMRGAAHKVPQLTHYAFSIQQSDIQEFRRKLKSNGVTEWQKNRSEGDSFYFLDPDGHKLEAHVGSLSSRLAECKEKPYQGMRFFD